MNLFKKLSERAAQDGPIRVGLIGAGKFGSMYLAQVPRMPGVHLVGIADLSAANARASLERVGWSADRSDAESLDDAIKTGATHVGEDWEALVAHPGIEIIAECTGNPIAAVEHCLAAFRHGKHVINVTVEADAFCGPLLAAQGQRGRRDLQPGLRRPAGAGLRPRGLGAHLRLPGRGGRARPQVAAQVPRVDARDGLGPLGADRRAGAARRPEPEDVQRLPRRLQAGHRERGDRQRHRARGAGARAGIPAGLGRRHPDPDAPQERGRRP